MNVKLFRFVPDTDEFGYLDNSGDWSAFEDGIPIKKKWKPLTVKYVPHGKKKGDFPGLFLTVPAFSPKAWEVLKPLVEKDVQACEITTKEGTFFVINVIAVLDCLDKKRTEFEYYSDGDIMRVESFVFKKGSTKGHHFFKVKEIVDLDVVVTQDFVDAVKANKLRGALFEHLGDA